MNCTASSLGNFLLLLIWWSLAITSWWMSWQGANYNFFAIDPWTKPRYQFPPASAVKESVPFVCVSVCVCQWFLEFLIGRSVRIHFVMSYDVIAGVPSPVMTGVLGDLSPFTELGPEAFAKVVIKTLKIPTFLWCCNRFRTYLFTNSPNLTDIWHVIDVNQWHVKWGKHSQEY